MEITYEPRNFTEDNVFIDGNFVGVYNEVTNGVTLQRTNEAIDRETFVKFTEDFL